MELLFTPTDSSKARAQLIGIEDDACTWMGIKCKKGEGVVEIDWYGGEMCLDGTINMEMLPENLRLLSLYRQDVCGEIITTALPSKLIELRIQLTKMHGTIDLGSLPATIEEICFEENQVTTIHNFSSFPESLRIIAISEPCVETTSLHIAKLPPNFVTLILDSSALTDIHFAEETDRAKMP